jgi:hypothetical protein
VIDRLSLQERAELNQLLYGWEDDDWDRQMQTDAASGKFDELIGRAGAEQKSGRLAPLL